MADDRPTGGTAVGLGADIRACLFDLDGVLTQTAAVHSAAWKESFDEFLRRYDAHTGHEDPPFDENSDYENYVDGKTREDGVRGFLTSRGIALPEGTPDDSPEAETVYGVRRGQTAGVSRAARQARSAGLRRLGRLRARRPRRGPEDRRGDLQRELRRDPRGGRHDDLFDATVDGHVVAANGLNGKPAPDSYLTGPRRWTTNPPTPSSTRTRWPESRPDGPDGSARSIGVDRLDTRRAPAPHGADTWW